MTTMTGCYYFHITLLSQNEIYSGPSNESLSELGFESRLESNNLSQNYAFACVHTCMYISLYSKMCNFYSLKHQDTVRVDE